MLVVASSAAAATVVDWADLFQDSPDYRELSLRNKLQLADRLIDFITTGHLPLGKGDDGTEAPTAEMLEERVQQALALLRQGALQGAAVLLP